MTVHVYIAGPMSSVGGNFNFPLFDRVADLLRLQGAYVFNPADHARKNLGTLEQIMKLDKRELRHARKALMLDEMIWIHNYAQGVVLLPGWERSPGAKAEREWALALGIPIREINTTLLPIEPLPKAWGGKWFPDFKSILDDSSKQADT